MSTPFSSEWQEEFLSELTKRPGYMTEVRRDGKDDKVISEVIKAEFDRRIAQSEESDENKIELVEGMREYAGACWKTCEKLHLLMVDDDQPENEKQRLDPDHWYEINLTNAVLFANLSLDGLPQLAPGRLFTTRMPRNIVDNPSAAHAFVKKCKTNDLRVVCVLTKPDEFVRYAGVDGLLEFYRDECGLITYNRPIPDFEIPVAGNLVDDILDLTYHLSQGRNCLVHCAGGSGRTGMVIAAVVKNLGFYDPVSRIRRVKSTYVETFEQEKFLKQMPKVIDSRILKHSSMLAKAIAAEHLIQVFYTHGEKLDESEIAKRKSLQTATVMNDDADDGVEEKISEAYMKTFDLLDIDQNGSLDQEELMKWLTMFGAEINVTSIVEVLTQEGNLSREKFGRCMASYASSNRRDYDITGTIKGHSD